jgi:hypothetical protein
VTVAPVVPILNLKLDGTSLTLPVTVIPLGGNAPSVVCAFLSVAVTFGGDPQ